MKNFINDCLNGVANTSDIGSYVEYWHKNDTGSTLQEFLGMSDKEFEMWGKEPDNVLEKILDTRKADKQILSVDDFTERESISPYLVINAKYKDVNVNDLPLEVKKESNIDGLVFKALENQGLEGIEFQQTMNSLLAGRVCDLESVLNVKYEGTEKSVDALIADASERSAETGKNEPGKEEFVME